MFRPVLVADGNFKADYVKQKNDKNDMWLMDGTCHSQLSLLIRQEQPPVVPILFDPHHLSVRYGQ